MRVAVALLFVMSLAGVGVVESRQGDERATVATSPPTTATTAASTTTAPAATAPPTTSAPTTATVVTTAPSTTTPAPPTTAALTLTGDVPRALVSPKGVVVLVTGRVGGRYRVETPCGRTALLAEGTPINGATVVLDAGHGGVEPGAVSPGGLAEKGINLAVVEHARSALEKAGVPTVLTRTADYRVPLTTRAKLVMALQPKAFVSVHHNAEPDGPRPAPGSETYYQVASGDSRRLAGLVYEEVVRALSAYQVPWVADTDAGAKYRRNIDGDDYYGILRRTHGVTAVLAELAFVSNPPEAELLTHPDVQQVEGEAVARAVLRFLNTADPGSGFTEPYPRSSPAGSGGGSSGCVDPAL